MSDVVVRMEREQIEVTRDGSLGGAPDYMRKFIPGLTTYYVTVDGEELPPMTPEQFKEWKEQNPHE
jgi:hypothetical protein